MIRFLVASALCLCSMPVLAQDAPTPAPEVRIPRMANFLEWVADGDRGVYIRGDTGKWYYARTQSPCTRLRPTAAIRFDAPRGELDRFSAIRVEGWRCPLDSVTESSAPAGHEDH